MQKLIIVMIFLITISVFPVFAQEALSGQKIILNTDKTAYNEGDVITITGTVEKVVESVPISLQMFFGKTLIEVAQIDVTQDGQFTKTFLAKGPMWQNEGTVVVKVTYGLESTETSFPFFKQTGTSFLSSFEVDIPGEGTFDVRYTMKGGVVSSMTLNQKDLSLDITINTNTNGAIDIEIPRNDLDSVDMNGYDEKFIILIYRSGEETAIQTDFREIDTNDQMRSLYIPIKQGDGKIQIIGTHVVPEFGAMIQFILVVAIISTIIITSRTRLSLLAKR